MRKVILLALVVCLAAIATWVYFQHLKKIAPPLNEAAPLKMPSMSAPTDASEQTRPTRPTQARSSNAEYLNRKVDITSTNLAKDWAQLQDTAKTDPAFAYALILLLHKCKMVANDFGGIENLNSATVAANQNVSPSAEILKIKPSVCADLTPAQHMAYVDMIEFAAASGVVEAQASYSNLVAPTILTDESIKNPKRIEEYRAKSMRYYHSAAQSGYAPALQSLSFAYSDGYVTAKDDYAAYKYLQAYSLAATRRTPSLDKLLIRFQSGLTPQQIASAQREAIAIYSACCRR